MKNDIVMTGTTAAINKAVAKTDTTLCVKVGTRSYSFSKFQRDLFDIAFKAGDTLNKAIVRAELTQRETMQKMLKSQYGTTCPTFEQFRSDRDALRVLALHKGLVDDQWIRKPYNAAVIALYGELPVSMSPAAIAKRAQRPTVVKGKAGSKKNVVKPANDTPVDSIGQFIAKFGTAAVLEELSKILSTERATQLDAQVLHGVALKYK